MSLIRTTLSGAGKTLFVNSCNLFNVHVFWRYLSILEKLWCHWTGR